MKLLIGFAGISATAGVVFGSGWILLSGPWWAKIWLVLTLIAAAVIVKRYL